MTRRFRGCASSTFIILSAAMLLVACGRGTISEVRYRVTVVVDVKGELKSASVVRGMRYRWGGDASWKPHIYGDGRGIAPVIDLGDRGWLVAAIFNDFTDTEGWTSRLIGHADWKFRDKPPAQTCGYAQTFDFMFDETVGIRRKPAANNSEAWMEEWKVWKDEARLEQRLAAIPSGPQTVAPPRLPAFIWFPRGAPFRSAPTLCPEEFERGIGRGIVLRSVTVELLPATTPIDERIADPAPEWLDELRRENAVQPSGKIPNEAYHRLQQVEDKFW